MRHLFSVCSLNGPNIPTLDDNNSIIKINSFNARSLMNKLVEFGAFISTYDPDCVAITETWLNDIIPSSLFIDTNYYSVFRKDRCSRGGGVCLLLKNSVRHSISQVTIPSEFTSLEIVAVDLSDGASLPYRIVVAYRPPNYSSSDNV